MFLNAIGTAVPERRYTKADCWEAFAASPWFHRLDSRARALAKMVLTRNNGIEARYLSIDSLEEVFNIDPNTLQRRFELHAPRLAADAGRNALAQGRLAPRMIDAVVVTTCTGYVCPGLSGYAIERLGLRHDVLAFDLVGQGCAGALPNWQLANALLRAHQCETVLSICVEVCSAAMYLDNDPGVLISACLFGDGAGAAVLSRTRPPQRRGVEWRETVSLIDPPARNNLRFEHDAGMLRNILTREVPAIAARHAGDILERALLSAGVERERISGWIMHAGGRDVLLALQERLRLSALQLRYSSEALREYGNLSSAFVYFVLAAALKDSAAGGWWWMSSFGAGFSCHGALLAVE
jgi:alkylresorcinol/alkylpyrone synthase